MAFCCCGPRSSASMVTAKNANQLRNLETIGMTRGQSPRLRRTEVQIPVTLNVYSLLESNKKLSKMGMGVFHTGVVVYGIEWGYGEAVDNPNASGLFCVHPGQAAGDLYRTIRIGFTTRSPMQVDTILHRLENEWRSSEYHILHHNCNHFAQVLCDLLSTTEKLQVPAWCNRAARVGDRVIPRKLATKVQHMMDEAPPKAVVPPPFTNVNEIPLSVVPRDWYLHPSVFQPMRYAVDSANASTHSVAATAGAAPSHADSAANNSHYAVEYDIVPPPGYEPRDDGSVYPPLMRREVFCATDENGVISHMTAIEEQPSVSVVKSSRSRGTRAPSVGESPSLPLLTGSTESVTVLARRATRLSPNRGVMPTGSVAASTRDRGVDSILASEDDVMMDGDDLPGPPLPRLQRPDAALEWSSNGAAQCRVTVATTRREGGDRPPVPLPRTSHDAMPPSVTSVSGQEGSHLRILHPAQPVGCITSLPTTPLTGHRRRGGPALDARPNETDDGTDTFSQVSLNHSVAIESDRPLPPTSAAMATPSAETTGAKSAPKDGRYQGFTDIVEDSGMALTAASPSTSAADPLRIGAKKKNPALVLLAKARGMGPGSDKDKSGAKYLQDTAAEKEASDSTPGDANLDYVSVTSSCPPSQVPSLPVQDAAAPDTANGTDLNTTSESASPGSVPLQAKATSLVVESMTDPVLAVTPGPAPQPSAVTAMATLNAMTRRQMMTDAATAVGKDDAGDSPPLHHSGDAPIRLTAQVSSGTAAAQTRRSPGGSTLHSPQGGARSDSSSEPELQIHPLRRRLSESAMLSPTSAANGSLTEQRQSAAMSLPDVHQLRVLPAAQRGLGASKTPERAVTSPVAVSMSTSPAHRTPAPLTARTESRDAVEEDGRETPLQPASRAAATLQLSSEQAARRNSSCSQHGEAITPRSTDRSAHTPMAPFPRRPSLLYREKNAAVNRKSSLHASAPSQADTTAQRNLAAELDIAPADIPLPRDGGNPTTTS